MSRSIRSIERRGILCLLLWLLVACQSSAPGSSATVAPPTVAATPTPVTASDPLADANVRFVAVVNEGDGLWRFIVTVAHPDTGWDDYADGWDVVLPDGTILKRNPADPFTRLLLHPHENEQPFTREQGGLLIPDGVDTVTVRAHDLVDGYGGREVVVDLTRTEGPDFTVDR